MSEKRVSKAGSPCRWYLFRLVMLFAPYIAVLVLKRACYFSVVGGTVVFSAAGTVCAVVLLLLVFSVPRSSEVLFALGATFALCALLSAFLDGAAPATGVAFLCKLADKSIFLPLYERARERALVQKTAQSTAEQLREELQSYAGRV